MRPPPNVTGISPAEGPPGTRVILRGEHLGRDEKDLIGLTICDENCLMSAEWKSANKIVARSGKIKGKGDVIVTTKSGGVGTCTVQFKGLFIIPGPLQESAVWVDEVDPVEVGAMGEARPVSPQLILTDTDPLGIYEELQRTGLSEEVLEDMFPDGSGNITAENFTPAWFLLEKHNNTRFNSMKEGLERLTEEESKRSTGPLAFAKKNVHTLMDSLETLTSVQKMMLKDETESEGGSIVEMLESILQGANANADALFQDVLKRQDDADSTRNALNVLQRFKFLFSLPQSIERNILQGDYEMVINDYTRSKSVFTSTDIKLFKKVLQEVDSKVEGFRNYLKSRLQELPAPLEEQKRFIRYLVELDTPGDPAWDCLSYHQQWLVKLLSDCKDEHQSKDETGFLNTPCFETDHRATRSDPMRKQGVGMSLASYQGYSSNSLGRGHKQGSLKMISTPPQKVCFVEELSELLTESLPDLWKLGQAYFSGSLFNKGGNHSVKHTGGNKEKQKNFELMIKEVMALYSSYVRAAFFPGYVQELSEAERTKVGMWRSNGANLTPWLPSLIHQVRSCLSSLSSLSLPAEMLQSVQQLALDLRIMCAAELFSEASEEIRSLCNNETWDLEYHESGSCITGLPLLYESIVVKTLKVLREVVMEVKPGESEFTVLQKKSSEMFQDMLKAVVDCLQNLAFQPARPEDEKTTQLVVPSKPSVASTLSGSNDALIEEEEEEGPVTDERLLIVLSNCHFIQNIVLPKLLEIYSNDNYPNTDSLKTNVLKALSALEKKVFELYIEHKGEPLIGVLETGMVAGGFRWDFCPMPTDVRNYAKEAIMNLVMVHAQVSSISTSFLPRVLSRLTDLLCDELFRLFHCVQKFSKNGALQGYVELKAFDYTLHHYQTDHSKSILKKLLPKLNSEDDLKLIDDLLLAFKKKMEFQLQCFMADQEEHEDQVER